MVWLSELLEEYVFWPHGRLIEVLSLIAMTGWLVELIASPEMFSRAIFDGFRYSQTVWIGVFASSIAAQLASIFWPWRRLGQWGVVRFLQMALASSIWWFVTLNFAAAPYTNVGVWIFGSLAFVSSILTLRLGWKSSSYS
ncbi:MAG: hypothetical protein OXR62_10960 [Ahrensia sp.]|nr:hypothetical protein [Ahrensia sp.]